MKSFQSGSVLMSCLALFSSTFAARSQTEGWPEVFNPFRVLTLNFAVDPADWETLRHDTNTSFPELVFRAPAVMWADGETNQLLVQIRQGKDDPIPSFADPQKVGLKVDINDLVPGQEWRGLKKLSLENGNGGSGVLREAVAMNLHRLAAERGFYDYPNGYATWVRVVVNSNYLGLYSFPEQRDKQFLRNRGMYKPGAVWLYEYNSAPILDTTVAPTNSPTFNQLCYSPFNTLCQQPTNPSVAPPTATACSPRATRMSLPPISSRAWTKSDATMRGIWTRGLRAPPGIFTPAGPDSRRAANTKPRSLDITGSATCTVRFTATCWMVR